MNRNRHHGRIVRQKKWPILVSDLAATLYINGKLEPVYCIYCHFVSVPIKYMWLPLCDYRQHFIIFLNGFSSFLFCIDVFRLLFLCQNEHVNEKVKWVTHKQTNVFKTRTYQFKYESMSYRYCVIKTKTEYSNEIQQKPSRRPLKFFFQSNTEERRCAFTRYCVIQV